MFDLRVAGKNVFDWSKALFVKLRREISPRLRLMLGELRDCGTQIVRQKIIFTRPRIIRAATSQSLPHWIALMAHYAYPVLIRIEALHFGLRVDPRHDCRV